MHVFTALKKLTEIDLQIAGEAFGAGSAIDVTVVGSAQQDVVVTRGVVELVRVVKYRYRVRDHDIDHDGTVTRTQTHRDVVGGQVFHAGGPLLGGQSFVYRVAL